jgi:hypothetical protein
MSQTLSVQPHAPPGQTLNPLSIVSDNGMELTGMAMQPTYANEAPRRGCRGPRHGKDGGLQP